MIKIMDDDLRMINQIIRATRGGLGCFCVIIFVTVVYQISFDCPILAYTKRSI